MPNAKALVFSDDSVWARSNLNLEGDVEYIESTDSVSSWIDMARMSRCQHFIISNSSYSWWGAWLSDHPSKIVIAPNFWLQGRPTIDLGLCPEAWILN